MRQIMQDYWTGHLRLEDVPDSFPNPGMVLVQNAFSAISSGTERSKVELAQKNLLSMAKQRPADVAQVLSNVKKEGVVATFNKVVDRLQVPISLGYSCAGVVLGGTDFKTGTPVACIGEGFACHAEKVSVPTGYVVEVPAGVGLDDAAFAGVGAIAIQGLRQAAPQLGETIGVIGLGLIGQFLVQALKANGTRVIGFDLDKDRIKLAQSLGMDAVGPTDIEQMKTLGLDAVIITAASADSTPFEWAGALCREKGRVVLLGAVPIQIQRELYYQKELSVSISRAFGAGSYDPDYIQGADYPIGYVRWTAKRNMETFLQLVAEGKMNVKALVSKKIPFEKATEAYAMLTDSSQKSLGLLLQYATETRAPLKRLDVVKDSGQSAKAGGALGFIGMGNFAQTYWMPQLKKVSGLSFEGVVTSRGMTAQHTAKKFGIRFAATDANEILNDARINTIVIATRHNTHADLVCRALEKGKKVYVEKPLALTEAELATIKETYLKNEGWIMVGFNRRFSPAVLALKKKLHGGPYTLNYRINAGPLAEGHWLHGTEGGGRLLGEGCHFIDLAQHLIGQTPLSVKAQPLSHTDDFQVTVRYQDGSLATITYVTRSDPSFPRERLEIFGDGLSAVVDDFKTTFSRDLGYKNAAQAFGQAVLSGAASPTPFTEIYLSSLTTIRAQAALATGKEIGWEEGA